MANVKRFLFCLFLIGALASCTKTNELNDPPANNPPPPPPPNNGKPGGSLYINVVGNFAKINTRDSSVVWTSQTVNLFGASGNPMTFDSNTFYHGNLYGITAYSTQTGISRWTFSWLAFSDALSYREPAFKDSLIFFTSPTNEWDHAYLYCLNKKTGQLYWKKQIDAGYPDVAFNATPMVVDDKVVVLTRDQTNHLHLSAFRISDAVQAWTTQPNDNLSLRLRLVDGKIYSTSNQYIICYNGTDGSLKWQTDTQLSAQNLTSTFFDQGKLVLVKNLNQDYTILEMDINNGNVIKRSDLTVPTQFGDPKYAPFGCNYRTNTLFVTTHYNFDTASIRAYDLSTLALKWEKRFAFYGFAYFVPLQTDKYLIFPINNTYPAGNSDMYFLDFDGNLVTKIPFSANYTDGLAYMEDGILYKQDNLYVAR